MSWLASWKNALLIGLLVIAALLALNGKVQSSRLESAQKTVESQGQELARQSTLIATMLVQDATNRALMAEQQHKEQVLRQQGETFQRKYRDAIKGNGCAAERMPDGVFDLLQQSSTSTATRVSPAS